MEKINIRPYQEEDLLGFYEAVMESKTELAKWLPWCRENYSLEDTKKWINEIVPDIWQSKKGCEFVILESETNKTLGGCCLEQIDWDNSEACIGYWIRTSETKKGLATFACHFLIDYGFNQLKVRKIKIIPSIENKASRSVAEKLPYESLELVKNGFKIGKALSDALVYSITPESYANGK